MKKNKNCLNCAFCTRNKNKFISFGIMSNKEPFWSYHCESLSAEERKMLKQNNDQFIGEDKTNKGIKELIIIGQLNITEKRQIIKIKFIKVQQN